MSRRAQPEPIPWPLALPRVSRECALIVNQVRCSGYVCAHKHEPRKWRKWDSNPRHPACKAGALPTELFPRKGREREPTRTRCVPSISHFHSAHILVRGVRNRGAAFQPPIALKKSGQRTKRKAEEWAHSRKVGESVRWDTRWVRSRLHRWHRRTDAHPCVPQGRCVRGIHVADAPSLGVR